MKLKLLVKRLNLDIHISDLELIHEVTGVYVSDLLSDVMANAEPGDLWITLQTHPNIVAVATLKDLSGIILVNNRKPEEETVRKAHKEGIPIFSSSRPSFDLAGELYVLIKDL